MDKKKWIIAWIVLYVAAVAMGAFLPETVLSTVVGLVFFLPPAVLLWKGIRGGDKKLVFWIRMVAIISLTLTTAAFIAIFFSVASKKDLDNLMQTILLVVSAPLLCFKAWMISIFGWACLLSASFLRKKS